MEIPEFDLILEFPHPTVLSNGTQEDHQKFVYTLTPERCDHGNEGGT